MGYVFLGKFLEWVPIFIKFTPENGLGFSEACPFRPCPNQTKFKYSPGHVSEVVPWMESVMCSCFSGVVRWHL